MRDSTQTIEPRSTHRVGATAVLLVLLACVFAGAGWLSKGKGYKTRLSQLLDIGRGTHPSVMASRPSDHQINVLPDGFLAFDVQLPNRGRVVDANTLNDHSVRLYRTGDHRNVAAVVNTSGGGDSIVLKPIEPLELNTDYTFEV